LSRGLHPGHLAADRMLFVELKGVDETVKEFIVLSPLEERFKIPSFSPFRNLVFFSLFPFFREK
jgi:hypothetical protein